MLRKLKQVLKRFRYFFSSDFDQDIYKNQLLCAQLEYLERQASILHQRLRDTESKGEQVADREQTKESFDYQWKNIPEGKHMIRNDEFKKEVTDRIMTFTGLPEDWFRGKRILDAGCGQGRFTWGLLKLGAQVTAIDISNSALKETEENCREFSDCLIVQKQNLLEPLAVTEKFDLVWSFGVLHHTGNTYRAFKNIMPFVKEEGFLFLMLYGEPRPGELGDYQAVNEYERLRELTKNCSYEEKIEIIRNEMKNKKLIACGEEYVHGYFDAISPTINDLYRFEEIQGWLRGAGFSDIRKTIEERNHHVISKKVGASVCVE